MNGYEDLTNESSTYHGKQWKFFFSQACWARINNGRK